MLKRLNIGYKVESNQQISHLLYTDDLKIFTRTEVHLSKALSTVKTFTDDINMEFSLDKCAIAVMKGGKQIKKQNMPIDDKTSIQSHEEAAYKYIGVDEKSGIQHSAMKEKVANEYYHQGIILDKRCNGGRELVQLMSAYSCSTVNLSDYIEQGKDRFCRLVKKSMRQGSKIFSPEGSKGNKEQIFAFVNS